jgi:hypothetical protein
METFGQKRARWGHRRERSLFENLSRSDARAVEQVLIEEYSLNNLLNIINSIARTNPIYEESIARGKEILNQIQKIR